MISDPFTLYQQILDNVDSLRPHMKLFRDYFISENKELYNQLTPLERRSFVQKLSLYSRKYRWGIYGSSKDIIENFITQMFIMIITRKVNPHFTLSNSNVTRVRIHRTMKKISNAFFYPMIQIEENLMRRHETYITRMRMRLEYEENRNRYLSIRNRIANNRIRQINQRQLVNEIVPVGRRLGLDMSGVRLPLPAHMAEMDVEAMFPSPTDLNPVPRGLLEQHSSQTTSNLVDLINPNFLFPQEMANARRLQSETPDRVVEVDDDDPIDIQELVRTTSMTDRRRIARIPINTQRRLARRRPREEPLITRTEPYIPGVPGSWRRPYRGRGWNIRRIEDVRDRPTVDDPDIEDL